MLSATWPHFTDALLHRFLTDDVFHTGYDAVIRATQETNKDVLAFRPTDQKATRVRSRV